MLGLSSAHNGTGGEIESCCLLEMSADRENSVNSRRFRDPDALAIFNKLADGLRTVGYDVTEPKHGKATDAYLRCRFADFDISIILNAHSYGSSLRKYCLISWPRKSILRVCFRRGSSGSEVDQKWKNLCLDIDKQLRGNVDVKATQWFTRADARKVWKELPQQEQQNGL
jgi:hypothetical protein